MNKLPNNIEEACVAVMKNPQATESYRKQALGILDGLGVVDYIRGYDDGEPPTNWENIK